jgi:hypothetical protein
METIPEAVENLRGIRYTEITLYRLTRVVLSLYDTVAELQERLREIEKSDTPEPLIKVKLKTVQESVDSGRNNSDKKS